MESYFDNKTNRRLFTNHLMKFDKDQLIEINSAVLLGMNCDQVMLLARPELSYLAIRHIKHAIIDGLEYEKVEFMANPEFNYSQMYLIKIAFDGGMPLEVAKKLLTPDKQYSKMLTLVDEWIANNK